MSAASALIRSLRPQQWVKNVFVAVPLVFARHLTDAEYLVRAALAVLAFCMLSGAVYLFNDVRDVESDRVHPTKRRRPIAAGQLAERTALIWSGILATVALAGCLALSSACGIYAACYLAQNVAYSVKLKQVAFLDVALIAAGFLLRVLAGAAAISVPASRWLLLCTALLATFLGLGKRAHELAWAHRTGEARTTRAALAGYRIPVVRTAMLALGVATCVAYVGYTQAAHTVRVFHTDRLMFSSPFVALGIVRYLMLALWYPKDDPPTEAMLRDPWFLVDLAAAAATVLYIIYG
ncbi:MAG: UbiA prenyltransferase [Myxococcales bacterium]|nr:UbiA prenyltransferase [Myxococcales bacterium]